jgi:hypothetical protein
MAMSPWGHERPELPDRDRCGQCDLVGLAAIEIPTLRVASGISIGRAGTRLGIGHHGRDTGGVVVKQRARVEYALAVVEECVTATDEWRRSFAVQ